MMVWYFCFLSKALQTIYSTLPPKLSNVRTMCVLLAMYPALSFGKNILTDVRVELFLKSHQSANRRQDADFLLTHFAQDASIRIELPPLLGDKKLEMTVPEYRAYLENEMSPNQKNEYSVESIDIVVNKTGTSAAVTQRTRETAKLSGQSVKIDSQQSINIELIQGKPLITRFHSIVKHVQLPEKIKMLLSVLNPGTTKIEYQPSDIEQKYSFTTVSHGPEDSFGNGDSFDPSVSTDGNFVVFASTANNLVENDNNNEADIFLYNKATREIKLISKNTKGQPANGASQSPKINSIGSTVVYMSYASDLVPGDSNGYADIFMYNLETQKTSRLSETSQKKEGNNSSSEPDINSDGRFVVFKSSADNLVENDFNEVADIFLLDTKSRKIKRVNIAENNEESNYTSRHPKISGNGQIVVFESDADNLVENDTNNKTDVFHIDLETGDIHRISLNSKQQQLNDASHNPVINATGQYIVFESKASNAVAGKATFKNRIYIRDTKTGKTRLINHEHGRAPQSISADGRFIIYASWVEDKLKPRTELIVHDLYQDKYTSLSKRYKREDNTLYSFSMSDDGRFIAFVSDSSLAKAKDHYLDIQLFVANNPFKP